MLFNLIRSGNLRDMFIGLLLGLPAVIICLSFHETAHGLVAYWLGDRTAKASGRLTLDPMAHIDPWGFVCMLLLGFGWAKPVPINISNLKNRRVGMGLVAAAGPFANFLMAIAAYMAAIALQIHTSTGTSSNFIYILCLFCQYIGAMSTGLGVFNLLPIHPLDGSRILDAILPLRAQARYQAFMQRYASVIMLIVVGFLWIGGLSWLIIAAQNLVTQLAWMILQLFI